jgi:hypothetical protein
MLRVSCISKPILEENYASLTRPFGRALFLICKSFCGNVSPLDVLFLGFDLDVFVFYVEAEPVIDAHVLVGDPDQAKRARR